MQAALVIILLLAILAGAVFVGHYEWVSAGDVVMPAWGWLMLGLGVFFTLLVGGGLFQHGPDLRANRRRGGYPTPSSLPLRMEAVA